MRAKTMAILLAGLAMPALAETPLACWEPGVSTGVFDWQAAPSVACRNASAAQLALPQAPLPPARGTDAMVMSSKGDSETRFTFSGEVYVGVAYLFRP